MPLRDSKILRPPRLRRGDLIGVVAPASPVADPSRVEAGVRYLEGNGFHVKVGNHASCANGYLAGSDKERAEDLHTMVEDAEVAAIMCLRGGFGVTRILPLLDFDLFRNSPKILVGFSDITALQLALWRHCRLITYHGPMVAVDFGEAADPITEQSFWECVMDGSRGRVVHLEGKTPLAVYGPGLARGRLLGGNLSLLAAMTGTPFMPGFQGTIFFLEEVGEEPYRIDRMLTQILQGGVLRGISGILGGEFRDCTPRTASLSIADLFTALASSTGVPCAIGARFGHVPSKITLPVGSLAELDTSNGTITMLEDAVS